MFTFQKIVGLITVRCCYQLYSTVRDTGRCDKAQSEGAIDCVNKIHHIAVIILSQ